MKTRTALPKPLGLAVAVLCGASALAQQDPFTYETPRWIYSAGDFDDLNADGRPDVAMVDKTDGTILFGIQRPDGGFDWTAPESTGMPKPRGLAVGFFDNVSASQVAVTAPDDNRFTIFTPRDAASPLGVRHVYPYAPGTHSIASFQIDGDGISDLLSVGELPLVGQTDSFFWSATAKIHATPTNLWTEFVAPQTERIWAFRQKASAPPLVAAIRGGQFFVATVGTVSLSNSRVLAGFAAAASTQMTYGTYDGSLLSRVILYTPGALTATSAQVTEPSAGNFSWGAPTTLTFPQPVQLIVTVPSASGARLAVLYTNGTAATFDYNGAVLTHRSDLPGNAYEMLAPIGTNGLLSRTTSGGWQRWDVSSAAGILTATASGALPAASPAAKVSNVIFVTGGEPFANPDATPVFLGHVRDWTTAASGTGSNWSVTSLTQGPAGLESPASVNYAPAPPASHALVNQYQPNISVRSLEPTAGPSVGEIFISPASGRYPLPDSTNGEQFFITFSTSQPVGAIAYRLDTASDWIVYDPNSPPSITMDATVQAFAVFATGFSPTRSAVYTFGGELPLGVGPLVDADGDGLPDQWEDAFAAYDPNGDEDNDGSSNASEFANGTDPRDATSFGLPSDFVLKLEVINTVGGPTLRLSWPTSNTTAILQASETLMPGSWIDITTGIVIDGSEFVYSLPLNPANPPRQFFRLIRP